MDIRKTVIPAARHRTWRRGPAPWRGRAARSPGLALPREAWLTVGRVNVTAVPKEGWRRFFKYVPLERETGLQAPSGKTQIEFTYRLTAAR